MSNKIEILKVKPKEEREKTKEEREKPKEQSDKSNQGSAKSIKKFDVDSWPSWAILILAFVVAFVVWSLVNWIFSSSQIGFVWLEIIKLVISFAVLLAIASVSESSKAGIAIAIFVVIFFVFALVKHDYPEKVEVVDAKKAPSEQIDYLLLAPGTHTFELEAGEETPWRGVTRGITRNVGYSSKDYDFEVIFRDNTSYQGKSNKTIPSKVGQYWKIIAHSKQTVYVTVM